MKLRNKALMAILFLYCCTLSSGCGHTHESKTEHKTTEPAKVSKHKYPHQ